MTATSSTASPSKNRRRGRKLGIGALSLFVLLVVVYFVATSSAFFKGFILPRIGSAMNAQITVSDASISPFSQVVLQQIQVKTTGNEPVLQAAEVRVRYKLRSILAGTIKVDELSVVSPTINVIENADGTSNVDPLIPKETAEKPVKQTSPTPKLEVRNVSVKNASVHAVRNLKDNVRESFSLSDVNLSLDQLQNGSSGKLTLGASMKMDRTQGGARDSLESKGAGAVDFTLGQDLMPQIVKGSVTHEVVKAEGKFAELAGHKTVMTPDLAPGEIRQLSLRFFKTDKLLGEMKTYGPFDAAKKEGKLTIEISSIDKQVLNLAGALWGIDFGGSTLSSTNVIELQKAGALINVSGRFNASKFSVAQKGKSSPPIDLAIAYGSSVNTTEGTARLESFTLSGSQNQQPFLTGKLSRPVGVNFGKTFSVGDDSALELKVTDFNLDSWKGFLGDSIPSGRVQLGLNLLSQQGGKLVRFDATAEVKDLAMKLSGQPFDQAQFSAALRGRADSAGKVDLEDFKVILTRRQEAAFSLAGSGSYDGTAFALRSRVDLVPLILTGRGPSTAISADVQTEGSFKNNALDLKKLLVSFSPTKLALKNEVQAVGQADLSDPKLTKGKMSITADTLDVTPFYDLFAATTNAPAAKATKPETTTTTPAANTEPEAMTLPIDFTLSASIGKLFLREIVLADLATTAKIAGNRLVLDPCKGSLNGSAFNAKTDVDVGVNGYKYAIEFTADKLPLEPIANSFSPEYRGQYQGAIVADAKIQGAGVTGASLKKSLAGFANFSFTNANLHIVGPKTKAILVPIGALLRIDDITRLPINWVASQLEFGGGNIGVKQFTAQSGAFEAGAKGSIPIADVITQSSLGLPLDFSLRRSLAQKADLIPAGAPADAAYVELPKFVTVVGTLGDPKAKIDKTKITGLLVKSGIGIAENLGVKVDGKTGDALKGVGNLLTGSSGTSTNQSGTNVPAKFNPLDLLKKPKK
jgi:uncharacterized protein involved in outer membrane biogenesis